MKKLLLLPILLIALSCSSDDIECNCTKYFYETESYVYTGSNGLPQIGIRDVFLYSEATECTDNVVKSYTGDTTYFNIECN